MHTICGHPARLRRMGACVECERDELHASVTEMTHNAERREQEVGRLRAEIETMGALLDTRSADELQDLRDTIPTLSDDDRVSSLRDALYAEIDQRIKVLREGAAYAARAAATSR